MASFKPALLHLIAHATRVGPARRFEQACQDVKAAQTRHLRSLLAANAGTEYGRKYRFDKLSTWEDFQAGVPVITATGLDPWVQRQMSGERNVLTAEAPVYYTRSTGSTGTPKHIPVTDGYRKEFQQTVHVALYHLRKRFPRAFLGRALYFVGSRRMALAADGNDVGTMSGFNYSELPSLVKAIYAWPARLFEVGDLKTRSFLALLYASVADTSLIAGIFPAPIVYLLRDLEEHAAALAQALRAGRLPAWLQLTGSQREAFQRDLPANRSAARRLDRAARAPVEEKVAEAWPSLRLVYCWTGATAGLYVPELQRRLGPKVAVRDAIYAATEGWCSIPMGEERPGGALAITSHVFEFVDEAGRSRGAWEVEDGGVYRILVTNAAGLYRYDLQDLVEVCGFHGRCPRIRFVRKSSAACNLVGEKLDERHVNLAVPEALEAISAEATFFTLAPSLGEVPGYVLLLEPRTQIDAAGWEQLRARTDAALGRVAADYGRLRSADHLAPLKIRPLPVGTYEQIRQAKVADGSAEAQLKTAHLVSGPEALPAAVRAHLAEADR